MSENGKLRNVLWWTGFTVAGVGIQWLLGFGVDVLVVGLVLALQEGRRAQTFWLVFAWVLIQEGIGSLAFGSALLWYVGGIILFHIGRWLFEVENVLFILMLGLLLGGWHFLLLHMMPTLQDYAVPMGRALGESLVQALLMFPLWLAAYKARTKCNLSSAHVCAV